MIPTNIRFTTDQRYTFWGSLITERGEGGGYKTRERGGGYVKFYPYERGGEGKKCFGVVFTF